MRGENTKAIHQSAARLEFSIKRAQKRENDEKAFRVSPIKNPAGTIQPSCRSFSGTLQYSSLFVAPSPGCNSLTFFSGAVKAATFIHVATSSCCTRWGCRQYKVFPSCNNLHHTRVPRSLRNLCSGSVIVVILITGGLTSVDSSCSCIHRSPT